jgi:hypothetical protein
MQIGDIYILNDHSDILLNILIDLKSLSISRGNMYSFVYV